VGSLAIAAGAGDAAYATASTAWQIGNGTNDARTSLKFGAKGEAPWLLGDTGYVTPSENGQIWVDNGYLYTRTGGVNWKFAQQTAPATLTNNMSATTTDDALEAIGDTSGSDQSAPIERNLSELADEIAAIRTALNNVGLTA
jgi:hypothetical protein